MTHKLQHLNSSGCEIDSKTFDDEDSMEDYIDERVLPYWESGDRLVCDGSIRECFNDYPGQEQC